MTQDFGFQEWNLLASELKLNVNALDARDATSQEHERNYGDLVAYLIFECRSTLAKIQYDLELLQDRHPYSSLIDGIVQYFLDRATGEAMRISMRYKKSFPILYMKYDYGYLLKDFEKLDQVLRKNKVLQCFHQPEAVARRKAARLAAKLEEHKYRVLEEDSSDDFNLEGLRIWNAIAQNTSIFLSSRDEQDVAKVAATAGRLGELLKDSYEEIRDSVIMAQWEIERAQHRLPNSVVTPGVLQYILNKAAGGFAEFEVIYVAPMPFYFLEFAYLSRAQQSQPIVQVDVEESEKL